MLHPGANTLDSLRFQQFVSCNGTKTKSHCSSCVYGKHIKSPFYDSKSFTLSAFDIIHNDL